MKAVKILKKIYKNNPDIRSQRNNIDINFTIHNFNEIKEAIKELEYLKEKILHLESIETDMIMKENRSCCNCKNIIFTEGGYYCNLPYHNIYVELDFYCNKWENKQ